MFVHRILFVLFVHNVLVDSVAIEDLKNYRNDPEYNKTTPVMVTEAGYEVQEHWTTTRDAYHIRMFRIPRGKSGQSNGKVVFLQHGILTSSADWVLFGPDNSLAFILADLGYDVWMGNARGTYYSRNHTSMDPDTSSSYWDFSWHEIGTKDLPAMIDYILVETDNLSLYYVGYSQGATAFYVLTSIAPEYNKKIKVHVSLAPIMYMNHSTSPLLQAMSQYEESLEALAALLGIHEFIGEESVLHHLLEDLCDDGVGPLLCANALFAFCGFGLEEMNITRIPYIVGHAPAGASVKQIFHYLQLTRSGYFRQYDYEVSGNLEHYGTATPPDYYLPNIVAPVHVLYAKNDWLAAQEDIDRSFNELGNAQEKYLIPEKTFNHLDFMYGNRAPSLVYAKVIEIIMSY